METGYGEECAHSAEAAETRSSTPEIPAVSAFFSLAALAEVAAMENVHRLVVENFALTGFRGSCSASALCMELGCLRKQHGNLSHSF